MTKQRSEVRKYGVAYIAPKNATKPEDTIMLTHLGDRLGIIYEGDQFEIVNPESMHMSLTDYLLRRSQHGN